MLHRSIAIAAVSGLTGVSAAGVTYSDVFREVRVWESTFLLETTTESFTAAGVYDEFVSGRWPHVDPSQTVYSTASISSDLGASGIVASGAVTSGRVDPIFGEKGVSSSRAGFGRIEISFTMVSDRDRTLDLSLEYRGLTELTMTGADLDYSFSDPQMFEAPRTIGETFEIKAGEAYTFGFVSMFETASGATSHPFSDFELALLIPSPGSAPALLFGLGLLARRRRAGEDTGRPS